MTDTYSRRAVLQSLGAGLALRQANGMRQDEIRLDVEHQEMDNFGASDCWSMQKVGLWAEENRARVADLLFSPASGIALSCWRFNVGGGINPRITHPWRTAETFETAQGEYDWRRQAGERWFLAAAKARGVPRFLAFVNSPPGRMTRNGLTFCDKASGTTNLRPGSEAQYARYLADIIEHFGKNKDERERIHFDYVSPVNEPEWDWEGTSQEGMRASNSDIKRISLAVAGELRRRKLATELALVESGSLPDMWQLNEKAGTTWGAPYGNYIETMGQDAALGPLMGRRIGYHSYGSDLVKGPLVEHRRKLAEAMRKLPGWKLWQTEYCILVGSEGKGGGGRDLGINTALDVARIIHLDLAVAGASAWQWWTSFSPENYKDGLIHTDWKKPGDKENVLPAKLLWALGHYSRFVRPGMRRVELAGEELDPRGLLGSAYKDDKARRVVVVYVNMGFEPRKVELRLATKAEGPKIASLTPFLTTDQSGDDLRPLGTQAPGPVEIPARSLMTLVAELG